MRAVRDGARVGGAARAQQEPSQPQTVSAADLRAAIDALGKLDYDTRTKASRTIRRSTAAQAVPALMQAVSDHPDGYVRYRALVLLTGFNDPRARDVIRDALTSPNDRLRSVAYNFLEHNPDRALVPNLLAAMDKESGEFVRPSLVRALAAQASSPGDEGARVRAVLVREAGRGQDFFRTAVIEALGDFKARYAYDALVAIASLDGPLRNDTAIALGKIGDPRALNVLANLQRTAPEASQPYVAAGDLPARRQLRDAREVSRRDAELRQHDNRLPAESPRGGGRAWPPLASPAGRRPPRRCSPSGFRRKDPTRAPVSLALATIALRRTPLMMTILQAHPKRDAAIELLGEGFDILEEDLREGAVLRATFATPTGTRPRTRPPRELMRTLIGKLDF